MKNPQIYLGFTLLSDDAEGNLRVSTQYGLSYQGLDDLQATLLQDILVNEYGEQFNALLTDIGARMVELGYVGSDVAATAPEEVEKAKGLVKRRNV